jgi:hypothetical protein
MFKQDRSLYDLTGALLRDERFTVRLGIGVLFEELVLLRPKEIGSDSALKQLVKLKDDPDSQVREIVTDIFHQEGEISEPESPSGNEEPS